eukprot:c8429_g1_i1 orf=96-281(+)
MVAVAELCIGEGFLNQGDPKGEKGGRVELVEDGSRLTRWVARASNRTGHAWKRRPLSASEE